MKKLINDIISAILTKEPRIMADSKKFTINHFYFNVITLFFLTVMLPLSGQAYDVPELIYYKFNDAHGHTVLNEASSPVGTNPAPVLNQTIGGAGEFGSALIGSGANATTSNVNTGWATSLSSGGWTIAFWLTSFDNETSGFPSYLFGDVNASQFRCFLNGAAYQGNILLRGGGLNDVLVTGVYAAQPAVVHFVYDPSVPEIRAYLNGVLNNTVAQPSVTVTGTGLKVGGFDGSTDSGLPNGALFDEFRVYSRALPVQEIVGTWDKEPGCVDNDNDKYGVGCGAGPDCDDSNTAVHPGATEVCNGIDDDCNGQTDEGAISTESFENGGAVPWGWSVQTVSGSNSITFATSTSYPSGYTAYDGTYLVMFNSFSVSGGVTRLKKTAPISTAGYRDVAVDFAWLESSGYAGFLDRVEVQWSLDGSTWTTAGTFNRYNAVQGWKIKTCALPADVDNQAALYIAFLFTSAWGNDCYLDLIHIKATDEGAGSTWYKDADNDGYGTAANTTIACGKPATYVAISGDCDDSNSAIHPDATEACNGIDDNCNGQTDEGAKGIFYRDADNDTYGDAAVTTQACTAPAGYVSDSSDVDDTDPFYTELLPTCEVNIIPGALGWLIGDRERTRSLLVIGAPGAEFNYSTEIKWESDAIEVMGVNVFFKRFMFIRAKFNGEPLDKQEYRMLVGECEGSIKWAR
jgi:hypothetical protein